MGFLDSVDEDEVFLAHVVRTSLRRRGAVETTDEPGLVIIQMDGVPLPLLRFAVMSGNVPTISRWAREGTHSISGWTARVPSTTPISQAGILHGYTENMPAFRWYEKESGQLIVANHPPDAALIEGRISDGHGLLADGGVSVSNLFSGDAPVSMLTMSGLGKDRKQGIGSSKDYGAFFATPYGFTRSLFRTIGEMLKEWYQGRRQVSRDVQPRIHRHGSYIALRGITNVIQRDLITALMTEQMLSGTKVLYADYLDYDEVAHHAGVAREESLRSMEGVDKVIGMLEKVSKQAPRPYHFVVLSDHGQSQGATFLQRYGKSLEDTVRDLMGGADGVAAATGNDEDWGPLNIFLSDLTRQSGFTASVTRAVVGGREEDGAVSLGPRAAVNKEAEERPELVVAGSGNLGLVWFAREPGRLTIEAMEAKWPGLVSSLARHPGVSVLVAKSEADGIVALGRDGVRVLSTGEVEGTDPFALFGDQAERAAADFAARRLVQQRARPLPQLPVRPRLPGGRGLRGAGRLPRRRRRLADRADPGAPVGLDRRRRPRRRRVRPPPARPLARGPRPPPRTSRRRSSAPTPPPPRSGRKVTLYLLQSGFRHLHSPVRRCALAAARTMTSRAWSSRARPAPRRAAASLTVPRATWPRSTTTSRTGRCSALRLLGDRRRLVVAEQPVERRDHGRRRLGVRRASGRRSR